MHPLALLNFWLKQHNECLILDQSPVRLQYSCPNELIKFDIILWISSGQYQSIISKVSALHHDDIKLCMIIMCTLTDWAMLDCPLDLMNYGRKHLCSLHVLALLESINKEII